MYLLKKVTKEVLLACDKRTSGKSTGNVVCVFEVVYVYGVMERQCEQHENSRQHLLSRVSIVQLCFENIK